MRPSTIVLEVDTGDDAATIEMSADALFDALSVDRAGHGRVAIQFGPTLRFTMPVDAADRFTHELRARTEGLFVEHARQRTRRLVKAREFRTGREIIEAALAESAEP